MDWKSVLRTKSISKIQRDLDEAPHGMVRNLTQRDLILMGIAAIIGAGIFSTIGTACVNGGPAVSLLFVFTAVACVFSALCYAEFASTVPISGSAYTYAYTTLGELVAWILGWNLIFEYAIGNIAVAISWSDYFDNLLRGMGINIPAHFATDYFSARDAYAASLDLASKGESVPVAMANNAAAWLNAPSFMGLKMIMDLPVLLITALVTILIIRGIRESKRVGNFMVVVKMIVVVGIICIGVFYVNVKNWSPFAPNGLKGVMAGVSSVFFAYIGFDAISTTSEECKDAQGDMPKAMIKTLLICTILYVVLTLVITGMVPYTELGVGDPLAFVFEYIGLHKLQGVIAISAVAAMTSVFLVFQIGQPRIWMAMSRDGLLPKRFSKLHPKYKTPAFSSILAGLLVAIPALFMNIKEVADLCSMGTLFAFALVSAGVLVLQDRRNAASKSNKIALEKGLTVNPDAYKSGFRVPHIDGFILIPMLLFAFVILRFPLELADFNTAIEKGVTIGDHLYHKLPAIIFLTLFVFVTIQTVLRKWSLIPVLGILTNMYLMSELSTLNWMRFLLWCVIGIAVYFGYSYRNSKLNPKNEQA